MTATNKIVCLHCGCSPGETIVSGSIVCQHMLDDLQKRGKVQFRPYSWHIGFGPRYEIISGPMVGQQRQPEWATQ